MTAGGEPNRVVDRKLIAKIARNEAGEVPGVVGVPEASLTAGRPPAAGADRQAPDGARLRLVVSVVAEYGAELPELAAEVRERVARGVENMCDCEVLAVDVTVADLFVPGEPMTARGLSADFAAGARLDF
jgi:uncharacterized alkaline shock family protein YloU